MPVLWTRPALADLDQIQDFMAQTNPVAAFRLTARIIERTTTLLGKNPSIGRPGRVTSTRELVISATPYIVVYRQREAAEILAVIHGSREWPEGFPS